MRNGLGSIDLSTLSWEDYLLVGVVGTFLIGAIFPSIFEPSKPRVKRRRKPVSATTGFIGGMVVPILVLGGGYLAYQYYASPNSQGGLISG